MRAGNLSERVDILQSISVRDDAGQQIVSWLRTSTVWAEVNELRAKEFFESAAQKIEITTRFRIRHIPFSYKSRFEWNGNQYEPIQIIMIGRKTGLEVLAKRIEGYQR